MDSPNENGVSTTQQTDTPADETSASAVTSAPCGNSNTDDTAHLHANGDIDETEDTASNSPSAAPASESKDSSDASDNAGPVDNGSSRPTTNGSFPSVYPNQNASNDAAVRHGYRGNVDPDRIMYGNLQGATAAVSSIKQYLESFNVRLCQVMSLTVFF